MARKRKERPVAPPPLFVVSGGAGASGAQLIRTALAQFQDPGVELIILPHVRRAEQVQEAVERAASSGGTIVHTLVDADLRRVLIDQARAHHTVAIDLMGRVLTRLSSILEQRPVEQPGLYRQLHEEYFERVEAMEFTVAHDDGRNPHELDQADIVLVGVSRVGKTPLSMYLALLGWKVANIPLVPGLPPPEKLFTVDRRRVVGLTISGAQLAIHRQLRTRRLQVREQTAYTDVDELRAEQIMARQLCHRHRFTLIDVTDKPIEESADEVITVVTRQLEA